MLDFFDPFNVSLPGHVHPSGTAVKLKNLQNSSYISPLMRLDKSKKT